jgi:moderate conductance mechanosensitive channel
MSVARLRFSRALLIVMLLCGGGAVSEETPAPAAAAEVAAPEPPPKKKGPWLERLWNRVYNDLDQRFDVDKISAFVHHLFDTLLVLLLAGFLIWLARRFVMRSQDRVHKLRGPEHSRKVETISSLILSTVKYTIYIASLLWILTIWGVDTQSLVVGSAVVGAAVGFGSQGLVQDIITGLSILAEEQLHVGDYVEIGGKSGAVEEVGLRVIKLRDHLGVQHVIFNRSIGMVSNFTAGSVQASVDIMLEKLSDAEAAKRLATQVCRDLSAELPYFPKVPEVQGVQESSTRDVFLRLNLRVLPQQQGVIETLFVDRIKRAFAAEKIAIPEGRVRVIIISDLFTKAINRVAPASLPAGGDKVLEGSV